MTDARYPQISLSVSASSVRAVGVFAVLWLGLAGYYVFLNDMDALLLWAILSLLFGAMFFVACRSRHVVLMLFMGAIFLSHAVLPPIFFTQREKFTYSGWTAVKDFDFDVLQFLGMYTPVFLYVSIVLVTTLLFREILFCKGVLLPFSFEQGRSGGDSDGPIGENTTIVSESRDQGSHTCGRGRHRYRVLLVLIILIAGLTNNWMYSHGIAMTGVSSSQAHLPFHLAGIFYYFSKFVLPVILFLLYMKTSRSLALAVLLGLYALWAGFSQVSRFTLVMLFLPIVFFCMVDRRYLRLALAVLVLVIAFHWVSMARSSVYVISGGRTRAQLSLSLVRLAYQTILDHGLASPAQSLFALVDRLGGAQDVVLAAQYDTAAMGGSLSEFQRHFWFGSKVSGAQIAYALYGFVPYHGFSVASGGFSARVMEIAGSNQLVLVAVSFWISLLLTVGEGLVRCFALVCRSTYTGYMVGGIYMVLLYFLGFPSWFYAFTLAAWLMLFTIHTCRLSKRLHANTVCPDP